MFLVMQQFCLVKRTIIVLAMRSLTIIGGKTQKTILGVSTTVSAISTVVVQEIALKFFGFFYP